MTIRCTVLCPTLAKFRAKGIPPDEAKTMQQSEIISQTKINNSYNARGKELGDILIGKLKDVDISWCNDGCLVISCDNTLSQVEQVIGEENLEIQADRSEIRHKMRPIDPNDNNSGSEEDIDEVFEPLTVGEKKKLKSTPVENQYKIKKIL